MPGKPRPIVIAMTDEDREALRALVRSRTAAAHHIERASIILGLAAGRTATEMANELGIDRQRVLRCLKRLEKVGAVAALDDLPRSGRRPEITTEARLWLVGQACVKPKDLDYPHELWTLRLLAAHGQVHGPRAGHECLAELAPSTVWTILHEQPIRPDKVEYYLEKRDPFFADRLGAVLELYCAAEMLRQMPEADRPVAILSFDEKPGIQAIATTAPDLPPAPRKHRTVKRDHEYKRLGTVTLSAAINLITGIAHHAVTGRHRSREFIAFLETVDAAYAEGILICILLDNHSAHKSKETLAYLATRPGRFEFVFTPVHASWLNYVETFFSKAARSVLRHIRVANKQELADRISHYMALHNQSPTRPRWVFGIHTEAQPT